MNIPGLMGRIAGKIRGDIDDGQFMFPKYTHLFKMAHNELVYQESFMALSMEMCGFTEIEADKLRKATAKKNMDLLLSLKDKFVSGAIANGEEKNKVEEFWEGLLEFARYSFNASINVIDNYSEASVLVTVQIMTEVNRKRDFRVMS